MVKSLIDPKKAKDVRDALKRGDFAGILGKKKDLATPAPIIEKPAADLSGKTKAELNALLLVNAELGSKDDVGRLIKAGANADAKDKDGRTALITATISERAENVQMLIANGANVKAKDNNKWTALSWALHFGNAEIIELLKAHGAK